LFQRQASSSKKIAKVDLQLKQGAVNSRCYVVPETSFLKFDHSGKDLGINTMKTAAILISLAASAAAFAPSSHGGKYRQNNDEQSLFFDLFFPHLRYLNG
jgi:hypothetical protein